MKKYKLLEALATTPTDVEVIEDQFANISVIPASISRLINLKVLNLKGNELSSVPSEIGNLIDLEEINLQDNQIETLPASLAQLPRLRSLILATNKLGNIPAFISEIHTLQNLSIGNNQITKISEEIFYLPQLASLDISFNRLSELRVAICPTLKQLNISNSPLIEPEKELNKVSIFTDIEVLYANGLNLSCIELNWNQLKNIKVLSVLDNHLTQLPVEICNLSKLTRLEVGHNKLVKLPSCLGQLSFLKYLDCSSNSIEEFPSELSGLTSLETIFLGRNQQLDQQQVLTALSQVPNLKKLDISECNLTHIDASIGNFHRLKNLGLWGNDLTTLPSTMSQIKELVVVDISNNCLSKSELEKITRLLPSDTKIEANNQFPLDDCS
jgi:Leucine-rich repeat (LRR) protein